MGVKGREKAGSRPKFGGARAGATKYLLGRSEVALH